MERAITDIEKLELVTKDSYLIEVQIDLSLFYNDEEEIFFLSKKDKRKNYYKGYWGASTEVKSTISELVAIEVSKYNIKEIILNKNETRVKIKQQILQKLKEKMIEHDIVIGSMSITNIKKVKKIEIEEETKQDLLDFEIKQKELIAESESRIFKKLLKTISDKKFYLKLKEIEKWNGEFKDCEINNN